ncbi:hypothetical protein BMS3Abin02_01476 [bacterium BMS3Abin02]|nr:hypothetical protein BMS3Abin02_01476 [bacterium BMS3Abin02]
MLDPLVVVGEGDESVAGRCGEGHGERLIAREHDVARERFVSERGRRGYGHGDHASFDETGGITVLIGCRRARASRLDDGEPDVANGNTLGILDVHREGKADGCRQREGLGVIRRVGVAGRDEYVGTIDLGVPARQEGERVAAGHQRGTVRFGDVPAASVPFGGGFGEGDHAERFGECQGRRPSDLRPVRLVVHLDVKDGGMVDAQRHGSALGRRHVDPLRLGSDVARMDAPPTGLERTHRASEPAVVVIVDSGTGVCIDSGEDLGRIGRSGEGDEARVVHEIHLREGQDAW